MERDRKVVGTLGNKQRMRERERERKRERERSGTLI